MYTVVLDVKEGILSLPFYKGNQARARQNCAELLALLRSDCSKGRMPERVEGSEPLGYLNELSEMKLALMRNDWCGACDALVDLFHFRAAAIDPVRSTLVRLLERHLSEDYKDEMAQCPKKPV